jgi:tryptophanase
VHTSPNSCLSLAHPPPLLLLLLLQTTKAHITVVGGVVEELVVAEGLQVSSANPFKGDMDCARLAACIERYTPGKVAFVRVEAGTNLIGGQPFSLQNLRDVRKVGGSAAGL